MLKAELSYNPYIMETLIRFNGHAPLINSLVEKYDGLMLQAWIDQVPSIFHDEMNGYDFELEFSGPELEFYELRQAFKKAGITDKDVNLFWKNELDSREEKVRGLNGLMKWLWEHPNRNFDIQSFTEENREYLEGRYPYIVLHGQADETPILQKYRVSIESLDNMLELDQTDLSNTPVVYCLNSKTFPLLQSELAYLLKRQDVTEKQLFFFVAEEYDKSMTERVLRDLGLKAPQMISKADEGSILRYLEVYPISRSICMLIRALRQKVNPLYEKVKRESAVAAMENREMYDKIHQIDQELKRLKYVLNLFKQRDNIYVPDSMEEKKEKLEGQIAAWKNKKTVMTGEDEAKKTAKEFNKCLHAYYNAYLAEMTEELQSVCADVREQYRIWFDKSGMAHTFRPQGQVPSEMKRHEFGYLCEDFVNIRHDRYVDKKDFLGKFFKNSGDGAKEMVLETTWNYQEWRSYALERVKRAADPAPMEAAEQIRQYADDLAEKYEAYLKRVIEEKTEVKHVCALKLSDEERSLQTDNDWFIKLTDQITEIERA